MLLAEALIERKVLKNQIHEVAMNLEDSAVIQEGDPTPETAEALAELKAMHDTFAALDRSIRLTNWKTMLEGGITLTEAIANRDALKMRAGTYGTLTGTHYGRRQFRRSASEIKFKDTLDREEMARFRDEYAQTARELDAKIQAKNWTTELME